jgi:DNA-binding HxlR family transcriptional regulator
MTTARPCSIADTLSVVGEKYSLLVLREVLFGVRRFNDIARNTGAPRDVLTSRLNRLVDAGVLDKTPYNRHPPRYEYGITEAGRELHAVLLMLLRWGDRHLADRPPVVFEHACGADLDPMVACRECGEEITPGSLTAHFHARGWSAAGAVTG